MHVCITLLNTSPMFRNGAYRHGIEACFAWPGQSVDVALFTSMVKNSISSLVQLALAPFKAGIPDPCRV